MRENNANTTANLGEENESTNLSRTMIKNSKNYKESCNIEKISEYENTGLPTRTVEPASGYFILSGRLCYSFQLVLFLYRWGRRIVA